MLWPKPIAWLARIGDSASARGWRGDGSMRRRLSYLVTVVLSTFATISAAGILLSWLYAPTTSPAQHIAFEGTMFAVTGSTLAAVVVICYRRNL
jgi:hypothetical protein